MIAPALHALTFKHSTFTMQPVHYHYKNNRSNIWKKHTALFKYVVKSVLLSVIKSNQIKSLLLSHHHSTSALVSEILMSVLQTAPKKQQQFTYGQTVQKNNKLFTYGQTVQKNCTGAFTVLQTVQKNFFTYGQYIFTDCTEDNVQNTHTYTQYSIKTHSIISDTLYTVWAHLHYVQYLYIMLYT